MLNIYSRDFHPATDIEVNLFNEIWGTFGRAIDMGLDGSEAPDPDADFADALRHSAGVFAAFKVHRMQNDMARLLLDENGDLKPFEQWSNDVQPIASHQCGSWLRTEYDTAVLRAHQAADWQQFEREKDILPNLEWMPSTSIHPGEDHRQFWGTIRPVGDPFWSAHRPGDRWNCKCSLSATDEPMTDLPPEPDKPTDKPQPGLRSNPGTTGQLFSNDHPYLPDNCGSCPFSSGVSGWLSGMFNARRKKDCYSCKRIDKRLSRLNDPKKLAKKEYYDLKHDHNYNDVQIDKRSGGVRATHVGHNSNTGRKEFFGGKMSGADLERECVDTLFRAGHKVILCDESANNGKGQTYTALDMQLDGRMMDIRSVTGKGWYLNILLTKNKQLEKYNNRPDVIDLADSLCLYFHDPKMFNEQNLQASIKHYPFYRKNNGKLITAYIKHVYVVLKGRNDIITYDVPLK